MDRDEYFETLAGADSNGEPAGTVFDDLVKADWISEKNIAETLVRAVVQRLQELDRQQRAMRDPASRERLGSRYLQTLGAPRFIHLAPSAPSGAQRREHTPRW